MSPHSPTVLIRDSAEADLPAIKTIYAHHVQHGTASFELDPPSIAEMRQRRAGVLEKEMPYLVAEINGEVVGYAYVTPYRPRPAYRHTVEDSVYVKAGRAGLGIGGKLLAALIERCTAAGSSRTTTTTNRIRATAWWPAASSLRPGCNRRSACAMWA